jgi:hypothetical protein
MTARPRDFKPFKGGMKQSFWFAPAAVGLLLAGCATEPEHRVVLTGNLMTDGPEAIAYGPPRDKVLWEYRTAAAAMRQARFDLAKQYLDDALTRLQGVFGPDAEARKSRGYFHAEAKKTFIGEPYERSMAYIYRGILYWMDGEPDNARACFRSAELEDSDTENHAYAGDWVLPDYLDGLATAKLGGDGADAFKRAQANAKGLTLPPYNLKANVLFFLEFGPGPTKYAAGPYREKLCFNSSPSPVKSAQLDIEALQVPVAPTDDVGFQAITRGGRVMDHVLGNKAVFKTSTDVAGDVAIIGGASTLLAGGGRNATTDEVGGGLLALGLILKGVSSATIPAADIRAWDNLPHYLSIACLTLAPGPHLATIEFFGTGGGVMAQLTKTVSFEVSADGKDKVIFISDQSSTPQKL